MEDTSIEAHLGPQRLVFQTHSINSKVLDVGCGDGRLDRLVADKRPDISIRGIDVFQRKDAAMPMQTFDGESIPYAEGSFDVVMFVDVLHMPASPILCFAKQFVSPDRRFSSRITLSKDR